MKVRVRGAIDAVLARGPGQPIAVWRNAERLAVLAYHGVDDPERFAAHAAYVRRSLAPISLEEAVDALFGRASLPRRAVLVTFDDGHRSVLEHALPILREHGIPAAAFVVTGLIGTEEPFWWSEVIALARAGGRVASAPDVAPEDLVRILKRLPDHERLAAIGELRSTGEGPRSTMPQLTVDDLVRLESGGVAIGNHTVSHPCLVRCDAKKVRAEIHDAHAFLARTLGHAPVAFAYPDGGRDERAAAAVRELGYEAAFLFDHRMTEVPLEDRTAVSRLRVDADATLDRFRAITSGLHPAVHRVRGGA
jgi:peptidoglycan/xylan/chitin deacetylase (PgdA/CDA1 family)